MCDYMVYFVDFLIPQRDMSAMFLFKVENHRMFN